MITWNEEGLLYTVLHAETVAVHERDIKHSAFYNELIKYSSANDSQLLIPEQRIV